MQNMLVTKAVKSFKCLQDACSDTCCKGWSMQLDDATFAKYEANNLQNAVAFDGDVRVMKRDPKTDFCVKFQDGICSIHKNLGSEFLGDACNFYPRVTRKLGDEAIMTLTPSCPEALRLMLEEGADIYEESELERLPANLKNWADEKISAGDALKIHQRFLAECKEQISPEKLVSRVFSVASSLNYIEKQDWADATNFMFKMADGKLPTPATHLLKPRQRSRSTRAPPTARTWSNRARSRPPRKPVRTFNTPPPTPAHSAQRLRPRRRPRGTPCRRPRRALRGHRPTR